MIFFDERVSVPIKILPTEPNDQSASLQDIATYASITVGKREESCDRIIRFFFTKASLRTSGSSYPRRSYMYEKDVPTHLIFLDVIFPKWKGGTFARNWGQQESCHDESEGHPKRSISALHRRVKSALKFKRVNLKGKQYCLHFRIEMIRFLNLPVNIQTNPVCF